MPAAIFERDRKDIHDRMVERFAARPRVHLLRIVGAGADDVVGMMAGVDDDAVDLREVADLRSQPACKVDQGLALIFRRVLLGVGVENGALGLALFRQRYRVFRLGAAEQPGDEAVLAFIGGRRCAFAAHHAVDRLDRH